MIFLALLLLLVLAKPVNAEEAKIGNVLAPRAALNFKGNTAWPYGLCEVRFVYFATGVCHLFGLFCFESRVGWWTVASFRFRPVSAARSDIMLRSISAASQHPVDA